MTSPQRYQAVQLAQHSPGNHKLKKFIHRLSPHLPTPFVHYYFMFYVDGASGHQVDSVNAEPAGVLEACLQFSA